MQNLARVFPLKWMAQGMRAVFLPDGFAAAEQNGSWGLIWVAGALGVCLIRGLLLSRATCHVPRSADFGETRDP